MFNQIFLKFFRSDFLGVNQNYVFEVLIVFDSRADFQSGIKKILHHHILTLPPTRLHQNCQNFDRIFLHTIQSRYVIVKELE
jgi:hypothetical protein